MTDPRVSLGPELVGTAGDEVVEALDRTRPIVRIDSALSPLAAAAAAGLVVVLSRLHPHTTVDGDAPLGPNPWGALTVADVLNRTAPAIPAPGRGHDVDIVLGVGAGTGPADLYVGGDDWTCVIGADPVAASAAQSGLGVHAAAALAAAEVNKLVLGPLGMVHVALSGNLVWNLHDHRLQPAPDNFETARLATAQVALLGCGSVGSSAAGVLACVPDLRGTAWPIDPDTFDPDRNPYRYPAATGSESGSKATWVAAVLKNAGWGVDPHAGDVATWVASRTSPGLDGVAVSSVDTVDGRRDAADLLARTTLSAGVAGLALHVQREHPADEFACPYCEFLDVRSALNEAQSRADLVGLTVDRVVELELGALLEPEDIVAAVQAGKVHPDRVEDLVGRRLDDLIRRIYAQATVPTGANTQPVAVSAPYVSWLVGVLLAAEVVKHASGLNMLDRRVDLDLSGVPLGVTSRRTRDRSGRCVCAHPVRTRWAKLLYG